jgi:hypothetical protein
MNEMEALYGVGWVSKLVVQPTSRTPSFGELAERVLAFAHHPASEGHLFFEFGVVRG